MKTRKSDRFFDTMFDRMSPGARYTFTDQQLDDIKRAFGARGCGQHAVDIRLSIPVISRSFYVVFLAGPERRGLPRLRVRLGACAIYGIIGLSCIAALGYLSKIL